MHRRLWLLAGAAIALLVAGATASASTSVAKAPKLAAAPFAQSWANVPRTPAGRKAKDVTGFNTGQTDQNAYWAALTGNTAVVRGNYIIDDKGNYHLDLASKVTA